MYKFIFLLSLLLVVSNHSDANGLETYYYLSLPRVMCESDPVQSAINQQPISLFSRLVLSSSEKKQALADGCDFEIYHPSEEFENIISNLNLNKTLNTWHSLDNIEKTSLLEAIKPKLKNNNLSKQSYIELLSWVSSIQLDLNNLSEALVTFEEMLRLIESTKFKYIVKIAFAETQMRLGDFEGASKTFAKLFSSYGQEFSRIPATIQIRFHNLNAELYLHFKELTIAEQHLIEANNLTDTKEYINHNDLITTQDNWGYYYIRLATSKVPTSVELVKKALVSEMIALEIAHKFKSNSKTMLIHNNIAWMHKLLGNLQSAKRNFLIALSMARKTNNENKLSVIANNLATTYKSLGNTVNALFYQTASLKMAADKSSLRYISLSCKQSELAYLAGFEKLTNQFYEICVNTPENLKISSSLSLHQAYIKTLFNPSDNQALTHMKSLISNSLDDVLLGKTNMYLAKSSQGEKQVKYIKEALLAFEKLSNKPQLVRALIEANQILSQNKNFIEYSEKLAFRTEKLALEVLAELRMQEIGRYWLQTVYDFFVERTASRLDKGQTSEALNYFLNLSGVSVTWQHKADIELSADKVDARQLSRITAQSLLSKTKVVDIQMAIDKAILTDLFFLETNQKSKNYTEAELARKTVLKEVQNKKQKEHFVFLDSSLKTDEALVVYILNQKLTGYFLVDNSGVFFEHLSSYDVVASKVGQTIEALSKRSPHAYSMVQDLQTTLTQGLLSERKYSNIYYQPDDLLHYYPDSLIFSGETTVSRTINVSNENKQNLKTSSDERMVLFAITESLSKLTQIQFEDGEYNVEIPLTESELSQISSMSQIRFSKSVNENATRQNLFSTFTRNSDVLHIALHHYFSNENSIDLGLFLYPYDKKYPLETGFVSKSEISASNFNNQLVFLNGCETYKGALLKGSGALGIASAFVNAGAEKVVSTLWKVSDRASMYFTEYFYEEYFKHKNAELALLNAQSRMSASIRFRHPYYWAGYVLITR